MDDLKDPVSHFVYDLMRSYGIPKGLAFSFIKYGARDHARVPMQWDDSVNAGFNEGHEPWQCMNPQYKEINVRKDLEAPRSIYRYYQKVIALKKENETAVYGVTKEYFHSHPQIIAYSRTYHTGRLFVIANFSAVPASVKLPDWMIDFNILLNNYDDLTISGKRIRLRPYQAVVFEQLSGPFRSVGDTK